MIYFIQAVDGGPIKIGSTIRLSERLKQLARECDQELQVIAVVDGNRSKEAMLHRRFAHLRLHGEWFEPGSDLLGFIVSDACTWNGSDEKAALIPVKLDEDLVDKAKLIAARRRIPMADFLSEVLRPIIAKEYDRFVKDIAKDADA